MLYVFLDVDGVLNRECDWKKNYALNEDCIRAFAGAMKRYGMIRIVLSSTWRSGFFHLREHAPYVQELDIRLRKYDLKIYDKPLVFNQWFIFFRCFSFISCWIYFMFLLVYNYHC